MTIQARNLGSVLRTGFLPVDLAVARVHSATAGELWFNATGAVGTPGAGLVSSATAPRFTAASTTLRQPVLDWASGSAAQAQWTVTLPPDWSSQFAAPELHVMVGRNAAASSDTAPAFNAIFAYHDSTANSSNSFTALPTSSAPQEFSCSIPDPATGRPGFPGTLTMRLNAVSTADNPKLYAAWVEYTRHSSA